MPVNKYISGFGFAALFLLLVSCKKYLPQDLDYLSDKAIYTTTVFNPVLGRTTFYANTFNPGQSSLPLNFSIVNVRNSNGKPTDVLKDSVDVLVWKRGYTGWEKTLDEIQQKRGLEKHPLWEVRPHSGEFVLWAEATDKLLAHLPDSGYVFDVDVSNSGGRRTFSGLRLIPYQQCGYQPNQLDPVTGIPKTDGSGHLQYVNPSVTNITGDISGKLVSSNQVRVYFTKKGEGNSLTFRFFDKDSLPIDPAKFNRTVWDSIFHGFNVRKTATGVTYDVAYPIPLVKLKTRFTNNDGSQAVVSFTYDRLGIAGIRSQSSLSFNFNIYEKGDWEIAFHFYQDNPRFRDE
jgi:hypothetical protein